MRRSLLFVLLFAFALPLAAQSSQPWFFAVLADPQFGMYAKDQNFAQESANFEFAITTLNRLQPAFVVICGDLVNRTGDPAETNEFKRILHQLNPSIPVYLVAGNHDLGNVPTPETLKAYRTAFGRDYYTFSAGEVLGVVIDSSLIQSPERAPEEAKRQRQWIEKTLARASSNPSQQIVVFQHIPYFIHQPGEPKDYFNIPPQTRRNYLDLLEKAGVRYVFAGHYHRNAGGTDGSLTEIVSGAVGMPIGDSVSGLSIVTVDGAVLHSTWYGFGKIPNQIDVESRAAKACHK